jgi:signal transduction histidine kinase/CheY-like chemotaxis protein
MMPESREARTAPRRTLKFKLLRVMLSIVVPLSLAMLLCAAWMQYRTTVANAADVERLIRDGIAGKGRVLTANHALALRGLVVDNAFGDVRNLVWQATERDSDLVYGLFLASDGTPWAYVSPTMRLREPQPSDLERFHELQIPADRQHSQRPSERNVLLFGEEILEFSAPVHDGRELLGTVRYGFSTARMTAELEAARLRARGTFTTTLLLLGMFAAVNLLCGVVFIGRAAVRISQPLAVLTDVANRIAEGKRDVRAEVQSDDELALLAAAFNHMLEMNQRAFEQLRETTERALEASRLKSEFVANMSHEIRTPMNGVMGMTKLMLGMPLDGKLRRYVETVDVSATALLTIINDVLDFSKMEAGKYVIQKVQFDPSLVVRDVAELLATRAHEKELELIYRVRPEVPGYVVGDPDRFRQILNNLVGNAVKFTERGDVFIDLHVEEHDESGALLRIDVTDSGMGIAEEDQTGIFDAFSQVDGSMVRKQGGTGLGLAIAKRLVEMMGGQMGVWSRPGVGSQFWFTMKVGVEPIAEEENSKLAAFPIGKRALVVESNRRSCEVIIEHMKAWGLECSACQSGQKALDAVLAAHKQNQQFDVAVIGNMDDGFGVRDLVDALRKKDTGKRPRLVLMHQLGTGATLSEVENEIAAQLPKPLRMSDLYNSLQDVFAGRRRRLETAVASPTEQHDPGIRLLVVDDNQINQFVAVEQLNTAGFEADVANNGAEAIQMIERGNYAIVLMDCQMPVMDGYTATREIRKREAETGKHQIIIALTAHAMAGERDRVLAAGMDDYVSKPLRADALTRIVARYGRSDSAARVRAQKTLHTQPAVSTPPPAASRASIENAPAARPASIAPLARIGSERPSAPPPPLSPHVRRSRELVKTCVNEMPNQLEALLAALGKRDPVETRAAAHKLKGSAIVIGAEALAELGEKLQHLAENRDLSTADEMAEALQEQFIRVEAALCTELEAYTQAASRSHAV